MSWGSRFKETARSAIFTAWSPIRSRSVMIFKAEVMNRRSAAIGCLNARRFKHSVLIAMSMVFYVVWEGPDLNMEAVHVTLSVPVIVAVWALVVWRIWRRS